MPSLGSIVTVTVLALSFLAEIYNAGVLQGSTFATKATLSHDVKASPLLPLSEDLVECRGHNCSSSFAVHHQATSELIALMSTFFDPTLSFDLVNQQTFARMHLLITHRKASQKFTLSGGGQLLPVSSPLPPPDVSSGKPAVSSPPPTETQTLSEEESFEDSTTTTTPDFWESAYNRQRKLMAYVPELNFSEQQLNCASNATKLEVGRLRKTLQAVIPNALKEVLYDPIKAVQKVMEQFDHISEEDCDFDEEEEDTTAINNCANATVNHVSEILLEVEPALLSRNYWKVPQVEKMVSTMIRESVDYIVSGNPTNHAIVCDASSIGSKEQIIQKIMEKLEGDFNTGLHGYLNALYVCLGEPGNDAR